MLYTHWREGGEGRKKKGGRGGKKGVGERKGGENREKRRGAGGKEGQYFFTSLPTHTHTHTRSEWRSMKEMEDVVYPLEEVGRGGRGGGGGKEEERREGRKKGRGEGGREERIGRRGEGQEERRDNISLPPSLPTHTHTRSEWRRMKIYRRKCYSESQKLYIQW